MKGNCSYDAYHMHYQNNEGAASVLKLGPIYCNENEM